MNDNDTILIEQSSVFIEQISPKLSLMENLNLEFSWILRENKIDQTGRLSFWKKNSINKNDFKTDVFEKLLDELNTPTMIKDAYRHNENSFIEGIGYACEGNLNSYRFYKHEHHPETLKDQYTAWRWNTSGDIDINYYTFHFFSVHESLAYVGDLIPEPMKVVFLELIKTPLFKELSGFWIRRNSKDEIDQVDLSFPWLPSFSSIKGYELILDLFKININEYPELITLPIKHLAFKIISSTPKITIYSSASFSNSRSFPKTELDFQHFIISSAKKMSEKILKDVITKLPTFSLSSNSNRIGDFYDGSIDLWRKILGKKLHYHAGYLIRQSNTIEYSDEQLEQSLDDSVTRLYPLLPKGGTIYDIGCGWGGPLSMIVKDLKCNVLGITPSYTQYNYVKSLGYNVRLGDSEQTLPPGYFDCILLLESFSHIVEKERLLAILKLFTPKLVMRVNCQDMMPASSAFGDSMHMISSVDLKEMLIKTGWKIKHWENIRMQGLHSVKMWNKRLKLIPSTDDKHIETLRNWSNHVLINEENWGIQNPLIELMVEI